MRMSKDNKTPLMGEGECKKVGATRGLNPGPLANVLHVLDSGVTLSENHTTRPAALVGIIVLGDKKSST